MQSSLLSSGGGTPEPLDASLPPLSLQTDDGSGSDSGYSSDTVIAEPFAPVSKDKVPRLERSRLERQSKSKKKKKKKKKKRKGKGKGSEPVVPHFMADKAGWAKPAPFRILTLMAMAPLMPSLALFLLQPDERDISDIAHGIAIDEVRDLPRPRYFPAPARAEGEAEASVNGGARFTPPPPPPAPSRGAASASGTR